MKTAPRLSLLLLGALLTLPALPGQGGERGTRRAGEQVRELIRKAEELLAAGRVDAAEETLAAAEKLQAARRAGAGAASRPASGDPGRGDHHGLFEHLQGAVVALRKLGRHQEAERMLGWTRKIEQDLRRPREPRAGEGEVPERDVSERGVPERDVLDREVPRPESRTREVPKRQVPEREVPEREAPDREVRDREVPDRETHRRGQVQLDTLRFAAKVLDRAGHPEAAASLERAARALQRRFDRAPSRQATARHLAMAAEILRRQGDREHAEFVAGIGRELAPRRAAPRPARRPARRAARPPARHPARRLTRRGARSEGEEDRGPRPRIEERVERLERAVGELRELAERLQSRRGNRDQGD